MAAATKHRLPVPSVAGATTALVLLTAMNFVNYLDRYILPAVQEQVKGEFHVTDSQHWLADVVVLGDVCVFVAADRVAGRPISAQADDCGRRRC